MAMQRPLEQDCCHLVTLVSPRQLASRRQRLGGGRVMLGTIGVVFFARLSTEVLTLVMSANDVQVARRGKQRLGGFVMVVAGDFANVESQ